MGFSKKGDKKLKILFLPAWYPSEDIPLNGTFIKEHAKAASLYNNIVVLYAYLNPSSRFKRKDAISEEIEDGVRTIRVKYGSILTYFERLLAKTSKQSTISQGNFQGETPNLFYKTLRVIGRIIRDFLWYWVIYSSFRKLLKEGWKPDIIHAHVFTAGVPAVILGKIYRIPVVITVHYIYFPPRTLSFLDRIKARFALNRAQIILPPTNAYKEAVETCYGVRNRFQIVPNVVDTKIFYPLLSKKERKEKRLLFVGNLVPKKAIPVLLKALHHIKKERQDFTLDIVGDGPNRSEYEELSQKLGLAEKVKFCGAKLKEEVAKFMQNCDFFIMPSLYEGFGVVYIEAMACGKPVIATNVRGPDEIVNNEVGILVPPQDVNALKEATEYMLDNYQNYSSEKIVQYARGRFSYDVVGGMLNKVYKNIWSKREQ